MKLSLLALLPAAALTLATPAPAPLILPPSGELIPGRYIVKMKPNIIQTLLDAALNLLQQNPLHVYGFDNFVGFAANMNAQTLQALRFLPGIDYIEQDAIVNASMSTINHIDKRAFVSQGGSTWNLGRISQRLKGATNYVYDNSGGANTCVYVVDTGINTKHTDFEGRASFLANFAGDGVNDDANGHGTHCAGIVASRTYGVAKQARVFAVKVLDAQGAGTNSGVLAGINFVGTDVKTRSGCSGGFIATMSLGGPKSTIVNSAVSNVFNAGVFVVVAAGNEAQDSNDTSPASEPTAYTIGATDANDRFASFSNFGSAVNALAPGVSIVSTWLNNQAATLSGTSMAGPHVAGLAAYLLAYEGRWTPTQLGARITALGSSGRITGVPTNTKNLLIYNNSGR